MLYGDGKAWFDDLKVEVDGKEYDPTGRFETGFESGEATGSRTEGEGYSVTVDARTARAIDQQFAPATLTDLYDAIIYIDKTSAPRTVRSPPQKTLTQ